MVKRKQQVTLPSKILKSVISFASLTVSQLKEQAQENTENWLKGTDFTVF